jgi:hypothetical protein
VNRVVTATAYAVVKGKRYTANGKVVEARLRSVRQSRPDYVERDEIVVRLSLVLDPDAFELASASASVLSEDVLATLQLAAEPVPYEPELGDVRADS